jgi:uncharacterized protein YacL
MIDQLFSIRMTISTEFFFRIIGAVSMAVGSGFLGRWLATALQAPESLEAYIVVLGLIGFLAGLILTPSLTIRPLRRTIRSVTTMPPERLVAIISGIFLGLVAAALVSLPLSLLPFPFRQIVPFVTAIIFCYLSAVILVSRQNDLQAFFRGMRPIAQQPAVEVEQEQFILLDTSVIIDGRILDISKTGFIRDTLLVPNFILKELQHIADSSESLRRNRGRRGLDVLSTLQTEASVPIRITDMDVSEVRDADNKLVALARHLHSSIMTNDYNLNRVAELQGVPVLNVNDLANAVKATYLPGENLRLKIIQEGTEEGQGVGFLEDGTMVVVENGRSLLNETRNVTVTKVLQTSAGRMVFARP